MKRKVLPFGAKRVYRCLRKLFTVRAEFALAACVAAGEERWCRRSLPNLNTRSVRPAHPLSVWSLQF